MPVTLYCIPNEWHRQSVKALRELRAVTNGRT
jgi:hypothetical protein